MTTRRDFLKAGAAAARPASSSAVAACCTVAHAQQPARQKLPVMVGGKRVKTIDVHSHCHFREAGALLGADAARYQLPPVNGAEEAFIEIDKRLAAMDTQAVDMEVLSINPFWYDRERDLAGQIVKIQNEKLAELCASKPDRFAAFASLTLQAPDLAVQELETAVKKQGLKGAAIGGVRERRRIFRPKIPSGLGQGRRTRRAPVHPSAGRARTRQAPVRQWLARQHDRQSAGDHDRAFAPDLRGHVRSLSRD